MKNIFYLFALCGIVMLSSCEKYDDSELRSRIEKLEVWQETVNSQITALQGLVKALESKDYVTSVTELPDKSGYVIHFEKSGSVTIRHGQKGADAQAPVIGVKQDTDGKYYWTVDGEFMLNGGKKIPTTGDAGISPHIGANGNWWIGTTDTGVKAAGADGGDGLTPHIGANGNWWIGTTDTGVKAQGDAGKDAIAPQVRIDAATNFWEISTDGGVTWTSTGVKATGDKGDQGDQGDAIFAKDGISQTQNDVTFTLADGTKITLPKAVTISIGFESYEPFVVDEAHNKLILVLPAGVTESDYVAIKAEITNNNGTGIDIATRISAAPWAVKVVLPIHGANAAPGYVLLTPPAGITTGESALLKVTIVDNKGREASSTRVVKADNRIAVAEIRLTDLAVTAEYPKKVEASVLPANATNPALRWRSSDTGVATVSATGEVSALKAGTVTITATSVDNPSVSATCTVTTSAYRAAHIVGSYSASGVDLQGPRSWMMEVRKDAADPTRVWFYNIANFDRSLPLATILFYGNVSADGTSVTIPIGQTSEYKENGIPATLRGFDTSDNMVLTGSLSVDVQEGGGKLDFGAVLGVCCLCVPPEGSSTTPIGLIKPGMKCRKTT